MASKIDGATAYAKAVIAKRVLVGRLVRLACQRHLLDLREQKKRKLVWCADLAQKAIEFFRDVLVLENGKPFKLEAFQQFIVGSLFGWLTTDGTRRFRTAYVEIGKGNGKSPLAGGIGIYGLIADGESAPEVYSAATMREQAKIVFRDAVRMVRASPELDALISVQVGSLTIPSQSAVFRPVSSEHRGLDGLRVHIGLIDELHEHRDGIVVDKIRAGTKSRRNALIFEITNSGYDRETVCWKHHEYSAKVLEGVMKDDSWFTYVCTLDVGDSWRNPKVWLKANPGLDTILPKKYLSEQVREAVGMPSKENIVRRLNFCEWTESHTVWIPDAVWMKGATSVNPEALAGRSCLAGLDMASSNDVASLSLFFPDDAGGGDVLCFFWIPEERIAERSKSVPYDVWAREGLITATAGDTIDQDFIEARILELGQKYKIVRLAFDRWGVTQLITHLQAEFGDEFVLAFGQGFQDMSPACKALERMAFAGKFRHGGNPVLRWMNTNVALRMDPAGNIKIDKGRSSEKVDGMVSTAMAIGAAVVQPPEEPASIYETRGMVTL